MCQDIKDLAAACQALLAKDVSVRLRLRAVLGYELSLMVTKQLAPFIHSIDYHGAQDLSADLVRPSDFFLKPAACFSQAAFNNLSSSNRCVPHLLHLISTSLSIPSTMFWSSICLNFQSSAAHGSYLHLLHLLLLTNCGSQALFCLCSNLPVSAPFVAKQSTLSVLLVCAVQSRACASQTALCFS